MTASMSLLNIVQQAIFCSCLATSLALTMIAIRDWKGMHVGDFVAVLAYIQNLFAPLNSLRIVYNQIIMSVVDLSNLLELLGKASLIFNETI